MTLTQTTPYPSLVFDVPAITGAPCSGLVDVFFPSSTLKADERNALVSRAKALCASCASADICLTGALERNEVEGVWGGQLFRDGQIISGFVGPGRPPQAPNLPRVTGALRPEVAWPNPGPLPA